jgi:hypothetical protein
LPYIEPDIFSHAGGTLVQPSVYVILENFWIRLFSDFAAVSLSAAGWVKTRWEKSLIAAKGEGFVPDL